MREQLSENYKEWLMKDVNKKRNKEGLGSITFEQHINNVAEVLKRNAERYKEATKDFDWSGLENISVLCGNTDDSPYNLLKTKSSKEGYVYDKQKKRYVEEKQ